MGRTTNLACFRYFSPWCLVPLRVLRVRWPREAVIGPTDPCETGGVISIASGEGSSTAAAFMPDSIGMVRATYYH